MMSDFSWLPGWAFGCLVVVAAFFVLALLCMPFAVFGTKPRLQDLEFQIAEMRAELRALNLRLAVSSRPDSPSAEPIAQAVTASQERMTRIDEDYLMPARTLRPDLPSYEDGPGQSGSGQGVMGRGDPETLPRRGFKAESAPVREDLSSASERVWSRAPWEQGATETARQPLGRVIDKKQSAKTVAENDAYQPRSEPKLRWPPRG
ncbi:hypothetical protein [Gluconobacter kondonii]|uniref:Uncharacterized protein n=1 Tax=Gluconobacter kondonii TaxID=941463 RepID=A0ABQ5WQH2_9PROT|nr:hypothetical protein [Gluconobacter kondonii]GBR30771.1 hypothetical protein AA3266_0557 [Gluconobacter kondonii NBRC 3266]GLQ65305.1 hypothetical protein GCM10007870_08890 [Gluconobacter kondonii]